MLQPPYLTSWVGCVCVLQLRQMAHAARRQLLPKCIVVLGEITEDVCLSFLTNSLQDHSITYRLLHLVNTNLHWHNVL